MALSDLNVHFSDKKHEFERPTQVEKDKAPRGTPQIPGASDRKKAKSTCKGNSRFPPGMTDRKAKATAKATAKTKAKAEATAAAKAKAGPSLCSG
jgi:hypothetical protein